MERLSEWYRNIFLVTKAKLESYGIKVASPAHSLYLTSYLLPRGIM
jgi:hypothetical protein